MAAGVRLLPDQCPDCGGPLAVRYPQYRTARPHPLYRPALVLGPAALVGLVLLSLGLTGDLTVALLGGRGLLRKELGAAYFLAFVATLPAIGWLTALWWRGIHRLPRRVEVGCPDCRRLVPCRVTEC